MKDIWIGSPGDVRHGEEAKKANEQKNDSEFFCEKEGITRVSEERWKEAQKFEKEGWETYWASHTDDRSPEHFQLFDGYATLKQDLGHVAEIGCGPFTQFKTIQVGRNVESLHLVDPLLDDYKSLPNCTYKDGMICGIQPSFECCGAENFSHQQMFDTIICINVLEHVRDAKFVLENITFSLKKGGVVVLGERTYNNFKCDELYDVGHPIRIKSPTIERFIEDYDVLYRNSLECSDQDCGLDGYLIAIKK